MREILFRGKRTDNGEWLTSYCYGCEFARKTAEKFPHETMTVTHWMPLPDPPEEV